MLILTIVCCVWCCILSQVLVFGIMEDNREKYDRQIRLWASSGQELIGSSRVLVIGVSLSQSELLKNLILAGIGSFTLLAPHSNVGVSDIEGTFYLEDEDLGRPLAESLALRLCELNSDVTHEVINIESFQLQDFLKLKSKEFDLIVSDSPFEFSLSAEDPPVLELRTLSYYSLIHLRFNELSTIDSHRSVVPDLKILRPWPQLKAYFNSFDLEKLDTDELSNVPYPVILYQLARRWNDEKGKLPESKEMADFKKQIRKLCPSEQLTNLEEAVRNAHMVGLKKEGNGAVDSFFEKLDSVKIKSLKNCRGSLNDKFWLLVYTLHEYSAELGELPTCGDLPDMDSDTLNYLSLKEIYQEKFRDDLDHFNELLQAAQSELEISFDIEEEMVTKFVKNCRILHHSTSDNLPLSLSSIGNPTESKFKLIAYAFTLLQSLSVPLTLASFEQVLELSELKEHEPFQSILYEMLRGEGREMINIASITGGVAAQEALKLLMRQYVTLEGTWVFDGISCESGKL